MTEQNFTITDPNKIAFIFRSLKREGAPLQVLFQGDDEGCVTEVADVDAEKGFFVLHVFSLKGHHQRALAGERFSLQGHDKGIALAIDDLEITSVIGERRHFGLYRVALPQQMIYRQRRECYRARVVSSAMVDASLCLKPGGRTLSGRLVDISSDGCRIIFHGVAHEPVGLEGSEAQLEIQFPGTGEIHSAGAQIKNHRMYEDFETLHVGVMFRRVNPATRRAIERFVVEMQREACRREALVR